MLQLKKRADLSLFAFVVYKIVLTANISMLHRCDMLRVCRTEGKGIFSVIRIYGIYTHLPLYT